MAIEEDNYPKLRFKGFSSPWEKRKLSTIVSLLKDGTHGTHKDGNYAYLLSAKNIRNGQVVYDQSDRKINKPDYEIIYKNYQLKDQDLLLTIVGSIGETAIYHENNQDLIAFQRSVAIIRGNDETKQLFLGTEFNSNTIKKQLKQLVSASAQGGIYLGSLGKLLFQLPNLDEQTKISSFFKSLDNLIAVNQRKLNTLKKLKKSYLQKMFPQNGSEFPELRFAGFTTPWEERKLGEISRMYQPLTITGNDLLPDGVPVFGANGFIGFFSEANHIDDQVTISARGEGTGTPSYVHGPVWITGNSMVVNVGDFDIDKYFLFANLTANSLKKYVTGGAQPQLTRDVLVKVPITLPNTDEQKKLVPSSNNSMILSLFINVN